MSRRTAPAGRLGVRNGVWMLLAFALASPRFGEDLDRWARAALPVAGAGPGPGLLRAMAGHLGALAGLAGLWLAAFGAGGPGSRWLALRGSGPARHGLRLLTGLGAISLGGQGLGLVGLLQPAVLAAVAAVLAGAGALGARRERVWRLWRAPRRDDRLPAILIGVALAAGFLLARLPDTHEDALVYHFAAPEEFLRAGRLHAEPYHVVWSMPLGAEMLALIPFRLAGIAGGKLTNLLLLLALLPLLGALAQAITPQASAWWAGCWLLTAGLVADQVWQGKNDLLAAGYLLAAATCLIAGERAPGRARRWAAAGWFIGLALGVKWTSLLAGGGLVAAAGWRHRSVAALRACGLAAACAAGGWWAQAWLFTGNPFHPFASGVFAEPWWDAGLMGALHRFADTLRIPTEASRWTVPGALARAADSPALLALAPLALAARLGPRAAGLKLAGAIAIAGWLTTEAHGRFLLPLLPWLAALIAAAVARRPAGREGRAVRRRVATVALGGHALAFVAAGALALPWGDRVLTGGLQRDAFLRARYTTWDEARRWINERTPPRARVLFVGEQRRLWLDRRVVSTFLIGVPPLWRMAGESRSPDELRKRLRQEGLTHLLYNFVSAGYRAEHWWAGPAWDERRLRVFGAFMKAYADPVFNAPQVDEVNGGFVVFALAAAPSAARVRALFLPSAEAAALPAKALYDAGRPDLAVAALRHLLDVVPGIGDWSDQLGACYRAMGRNDAALAALVPFIDFGMVDGYNLRVAGMAAFAAGRPALGERLLRQAIERYPERAADLARVLALRGLR